MKAWNKLPIMRFTFAITSWHALHDIG